MALVKKRRVTRTGSSLTVTLPEEFVKAHGLQAGDEVAVLADHWLQVVPYKPIDTPVVRLATKGLIKDIRRVFGLPRNEPVIMWDKDLKQRIMLKEK